MNIQNRSDENTRWILDGQPMGSFANVPGDPGHDIRDRINGTSAACDRYDALAEFDRKGYANRPLPLRQA